MDIIKSDVVVTMTQEEKNAIDALLYSFRGSIAGSIAFLTEINNAYSLGLGKNHIATLAGLSD